jgi:hypothetical protein
LGAKIKREGRIAIF